MAGLKMVEGAKPQHITVRPPRRAKHTSRSPNKIMQNLQLTYVYVLQLYSRFTHWLSDLWPGALDTTSVRRHLKIVHVFHPHQPRAPRNETYSLEDDSFFPQLTMPFSLVLLAIDRLRTREPLLFTM